MSRYFLFFLSYTKFPVISACMMMEFTCARLFWWLCFYVGCSGALLLLRSHLPPALHCWTCHRPLSPLLPGLLPSLYFLSSPSPIFSKSSIKALCVLNAKCSAYVLRVFCVLCACCLWVLRVFCGCAACVLRAIPKLIALRAHTNYIFPVKCHKALQQIKDHEQCM